MRTGKNIGNFHYRRVVLETAIDVEERAVDRFVFGDVCFKLQSHSLRDEGRHLEICDFQLNCDFKGGLVFLSYVYYLGNSL